MLPFYCTVLCTRLLKEISDSFVHRTCLKNQDRHCNYQYSALCIKFSQEKQFILSLSLCLYCIAVYAERSSNEALNRLHRGRLRQNQKPLQTSVFNCLLLNLAEIDFYSFFSLHGAMSRRLCKKLSSPHPLWSMSKGKLEETENIGIQSCFWCIWKKKCMEKRETL